VVVADLARIAALRGFRLIRAVTASDHVHVLLGCEDDRDVPRLVQLVKGALSRALSVAGGDAPAESVGGERLPHHKWWARQYSFRVLRQDELAPVVAALDRHADVPGSTLS
jgi:REP element-mobilizing transposase RayT